MARKPSYSHVNVALIVSICDDNGYLYEWKSEDQIRVYGATHVIDIWPARMVYHRISGETIKAVEPYHDNLRQKARREQVERLLATGEFS